MIPLIISWPNTWWAYLAATHHVKNSLKFAHFLGSLRVDIRNIMASFNVVSLFTIVLINEAVYVLRRHFEDIMRLSLYVLTSSYSASMTSTTDKSMVWPWAYHYLRQ